MTKSAEQRKSPLIFYGWVIVAVTFITFFIAFGFRFSFSVFYVAILEEFGWSRASTAGIFSLNILFFGISALIVGVLLDKFGPRIVIPAGAILMGAGALACRWATEIWHLYLLFGIVIAFAMCLVGPVSHIPVLSDWFVRKRGTALGIATAGTGGGLLLALLAQWLIDTLDWQRAFLVFGIIIVAAIAPLAAVFQRRRPQEMGLLPDGIASSQDGSNMAQEVEEDVLVVDKEWAATEWTLAKAVKTRRFWLLFSRLFFWGFAFNLILTHQVAFVVDVGYSKMFAASIFGFYGVMNGIGRLGGFVSDRIGREGAYTLGSIGAALALVLLLLVTDDSHPWMLYLYAIVFGLSLGLATPAGIATTADLFQGRNFGTINGFIISGFGFGGAIGPWLGGLIYDQYESYVPAFALVIVAILAACVMVWIAAPRKVRLVRKPPVVEP